MAVRLRARRPRRLAFGPRGVRGARDSRGAERGSPPIKRLVGYVRRPHDGAGRGMGPSSNEGAHVTDHIFYDVEDGIATITIDRPEKRNAMTYEMLTDFIETVGYAGSDTEARVVILTGTEGSFCAGTDLGDLSTVPGESRPVRGEA